MRQASAGPGEFGNRDTWPIKLSFILICGLFIVHALHYWLLIDDAFISFRYARNLVDGVGLVFNPGEKIEGYSNLLWTLIMAGGMTIDVAPETLSRLIAFLSSITVLGLSWRLARRLLPDEPVSGWLSLLPPLLLACNRSFAAWNGGGLETRFFTMLVMAGLYLGLELHERRASAWLAPVLALLVLTRVDGVMYAGILAVGAWFKTADVPTLRRAMPLMTVVSTVAAQTVFRILYYGDALPNTFYAKVGGVPLQMGVEYLWSAFVGQGLVLMLALGLCVVLPGSARSLTAGVCWALICAHLLYTLQIGGDHFEFRFLDVIWPLAAILAVAGWRSLVAVAPALLRPTAIIVPLLALLIWNGLAVWTGYPLPDRTVVSIRYEAGLCRDWQKIGRWFARNAAPDEVIAVRPAGAIPYFSGLHALDMHGLNDRIIAKRPLQTPPTVSSGPTPAGHFKLATPEDVFIRAHTDYFLGHPDPTRVRPHHDAPRILHIGGRSFALIPVIHDFGDFWLRFVIISEQAATTYGVDLSRLKTGIRPSTVSRP
jgi:arabinofuranosyltransferase